MTLAADSSKEIRTFDQRISNWGHSKMGDRQTLQRYVKDGTLTVHVHIICIGDVKEMAVKTAPAGGAVRAKGCEQPSGLCGF